MDLFQQTTVLNLDAILDDTIITATGENGRLIMNRSQLFARLGKKRPKRVAPAPKATRAKSDKP